MPDNRKRMNIVTFCDDTYSRYVLINLINAHHVLSAKYDVHFYLIQSRISKTNLALIIDFADSLDLNFHNVAVQNDEFLADITRFAIAEDRERFYTMSCHLFLPEDIDRVLYVDTGDVLFLSDAYDFYDTPFNDKSLVVCTYWRLQKDKWNFAAFDKLWGGFNAGHMLLNLKKMRENYADPAIFLSYVEAWAAACPEKDVLYGGDQAFLTAFFAGDIETIERVNPYNIKVAALSGVEPQFDIKSVHLNDMFRNIKPWQVPFEHSDDLVNFRISVRKDQSKNGIGQTYFTDLENKYIMLWWEYCKMTPIYAELKQDSFQCLKLPTLMARHIKEINSSEERFTA